MQTFGLPRQIARGVSLAPGRDALKRWRQARAGGLTARAAANAVGVPGSTLYRWQRLADRNRLDQRFVWPEPASRTGGRC